MWLTCWWKDYLRSVGLDFTLEEQARITDIAEELRMVLESAKKRRAGKPPHRELKSLWPTLNENEQSAVC